MEGGADVVEAVSPAADERLPRSGRWAVRGIRWMLARAPVLEDVRDPLSGFRAYRVSVLRKALAERAEGRLFERNGWAANVELLLAVLPFARRVEAVEVERREHLRQRATRFAAWDTVAQLWDVARRARRIPAPAEPEENAAA
jgi:dolichol-phosphate mannosyltransferase